MVKDALSGLMDQVKKMQEKMEETRLRLSEMEVTGEAGAGLVRISMNGNHGAKKVYLEAQVLQESKDVIEDLIAAAVNDAAQKIERANKEQLSQMMPSLPAGLGLKWPF